MRATGKHLTLIAPRPAALHPFLQWLVICGALASFAMAWGIGANDGETKC